MTGTARVFNCLFQLGVEMKHSGVPEEDATGKKGMDSFLKMVLQTHNT